MRSTFGPSFSNGREFAGDPDEYSNGSREGAPGLKGVAN